MNKKERLFFLDSARGLGMLLVILGHILETDGPIPVLIYSFHIPLFFLISGILLAYMQAEERSIRQTVLQGLKRLLIPYLFFELLFLLFYGIRNRFDFGGQNIFGGLVLNPLNVPLWFLPTLFLAELTVILLVKADKKRRVLVTAGVLLYLIPFFLDSGGSPVLSAVLRYCTSVGFTVFGYVGSGFILGQTPSLLLPAVLLVPDVLLALLNGKTGIYKLTFGNPVLFTICGITGSFLVLSALGHVRIRVLEWIGKNTLVFLGLHIIALRIVQLIPGLNTDTLPGGLAALVLVCVLLTPATLFMNRFTPILAGKNGFK